MDAASICCSLHLRAPTTAPRPAHRACTPMPRSTASCRLTRPAVRAGGSTPCLQQRIARRLVRLPAGPTDRDEPGLIDGIEHREDTWDLVRPWRLAATGRQAQPATSTSPHASVLRCPHCARPPSPTNTTPTWRSCPATGCDGYDEFDHRAVGTQTCARLCSSPASPTRACATPSAPSPRASSPTTPASAQPQRRSDS